MMNVCKLALVAAVCVSPCAYAEAQKADAKPSKMDAQQAEKERLARRDRVLKKTGGFILDRRETKGKYGIVNLQKRVDVAPIKSVASHIEQDCWITVEVKDGEAVPKLNEIPAALAKYGVNAATFVIDDPDMPLMVDVPESRGAFVNVAALTKDSPDKIRLEKRLMKEIVRSVGAVFGCGYTLTNAGPMRPITKVEELDEILLQHLPVEASSTIQRQAVFFDFKPMRRAFYKVALEEGWAPEPVNEYQRAAKEAFEKQRSQMPTEPITIKPESKR